MGFRELIFIGFLEKRLDKFKVNFSTVFFDREVRCGHRNSFVVVVLVVLVVLVGRLLSKIAEIHYSSAIALF